MIVVHHSLDLHPVPTSLKLIPVDRHTLAKRRWRGSAEDGTDFGFDLEHALADGALVHVANDVAYQISQKPEPVLEVHLPAEPGDAARVGWMIGNLHFPMEAGAEVIRVADDPALEQLFQREGWEYRRIDAVFHPLAAHSHHHHGHEH